MTPLFSLNQVKASIARFLLEANAQGRDNAVVVKVFDDLDLLAGTAIPSYNLTPCDTGVAHDHNTIDATIDAGELPVASEELSVTKKRGVCRRFTRFGTCKYGMSEKKGVSHRNSRLVISANMGTPKKGLNFGHEFAGHCT